MSPLPLHDRIVLALRLAPMTVAQLATCLSANHWSVRREVAELHVAGVLAPGGFRHRQQLHQLASMEMAA